MHRYLTQRLSILSIALALAGAAPLSASEGLFTVEARDLARSLELAEVDSVAVVDFVDLRGRVSELGRFLADELSAALAATDSPVRVVDRLRLATVLEERKLSATGLLDEAAARDVGRIAGVDVLITGRLTSFQETVRVSLTGLRAGSAETVTSAVIKVPRTPAIAELETRALTIDCEPAIGAGGGGAGEILFDTPVEQRFEVSKHSLTFSLHGCTRVERTVYCGVGVRRLEGEKNLYLSGKTRAVFDRGGPMAARRVSLGNEWATGELSTVGSTVFPDFPAAIVVVFEGVPESASKIILLELDFYGFSVRFREVTIDR